MVDFDTHNQSFLGQNDRKRRLQMLTEAQIALGFKEQDWKGLRTMLKRCHYCTIDFKCGVMHVTMSKVDDDIVTIELEIGNEHRSRKLSYDYRLRELAPLFLPSSLNPPRRSRSRFRPWEGDDM